jgi:hypothetical protein
MAEDVQKVSRRFIMVPCSYDSIMRRYTARRLFTTRESLHNHKLESEKKKGALGSSQRDGEAQCCLETKERRAIFSFPFFPRPAIRPVALSERRVCRSMF